MLENKRRPGKAVTRYDYTHWVEMRTLFNIQCGSNVLPTNLANYVVTDVQAEEFLKIGTYFALFS